MSHEERHRKKEMWYDKGKKVVADMTDKKRMDEVGAYIETYYVPDHDDIKLDKEIHTIFDRITSFRKKRAARKNAKNLKESQMDETYVGCDPGVDGVKFDTASMEKKKITAEMSSTMPINWNIDDLIARMEETFSQRLLRMIDERNLKDSEVYTKANVDRRHFSKIRKDVNYTPNKKTVLAFTIALELSLDEAKDLLASAGYALSRSSKMDIIVAYFLQNKIYDMFEINDVLYAYGQPVFG